MAYRYRYRRSRYVKRYGRRRYYKNRFTRKLARSLAQKDTCRLILSSKPELFSLKFISMDASTGLFQTEIKPFNPMRRLVGWASNAETPVVTKGLDAFENFRKLFDQFKVNAIRIKLQIVAQPSGSNVNAAMIVRSAIDRNGLAPEFNSLLVDQDVETPTSANINAANPTFESYSSFNSKIINSSDLYSLYRTFYPIGKERGQWYGASFKYEGLAHDYDANTSNIIYPFRPILMLQFMTQGIASSQVESFNVSFDFDVTFKGQRNLSSS